MQKIIFSFVCLLISVSHLAAQSQDILFRNFTLIDGTGQPPVKNVDMRISGNNITGIGMHLGNQGARVIDLEGKTVMPALISAHTHVGTLKGTTTTGTNYTRENILRQLKKYNDYGVSAVMVMGTDRPLIFAGLLDSSMKGLLPGARMYSAGYGFGVPQGGPSVASAMDLVNRPENAEQATREVDSLHAFGIDIVKIWVDDFNGTSPKMKPEVYEAIISRAHQYGMRVASHLYYLEDARKLVAAGVDIIAHSIRDKDVDDQLLRDMKQKGTLYIPTLSLDEFAFIYARRPEWINDPFFKASLEPGVYEMITSESYMNGIKNSPTFEKNEKAFQTAQRNLQRIFAAGIPVSLGTDSGATPIRVQGFSEHLELELMVQAGLTPLEAITAGTRNAAMLLHINERYGTLEVGKSADLIILADDPVNDIKNTRKIDQVWKGGVVVNR
jgi:imidazolonepropionase-like amidohydrolase